jgi:hypothetical protein
MGVALAIPAAARPERMHTALNRYLAKDFIMPPLPSFRLARQNLRRGSDPWHCAREFKRLVHEPVRLMDSRIQVVQRSEAKARIFSQDP